MPPTPGASVGGMWYHVINRGNARMEVFNSPSGYAALVTLLRQADERLSSHIIADCLTYTHIHLVVLGRLRKREVSGHRLFFPVFADKVRTWKTGPGGELSRGRILSSKLSV